MENNTTNAREQYKVVYQRISYYKNNSYDLSFHKYLDGVILEVANSTKRPEEFLAELDANYQKYLSVVAEQKKEKAAERNRRVEYNIGVGVLSVFGIAFILYGIFRFGREYITDLVLMCILYALAAGVVAFAQLALYKKHEAVCQLVSGMGFSLAYYTTLYSYYGKNVFSLTAAAVIIAVISLLALILNRFRKSEFVEIVAGLGVASVVLPFDGIRLEKSFLICGILIAAVNLVFYIVNVKHSGPASKIIRTVIMIIAGLCMMISYDYSDVNFWYKGGLSLVFALVFAVAFIVNKDDNSVKYACLAGSAIFCFALVKTEESTVLPFVVALVGVALISLIIYIYNRKNEEKWLGYILFISFLVLKGCAFGNTTVSILIVFAAMLISKLMLYIDSDVLNIYDCVLTGFSLFMTLALYKEPLIYTIIAVAVAGCFVAKKLRLYHVVFTSIAMICFSFLNDALWLSISFMVVALLLIGYGCYINRFEVRLSGLILSLVVCFKVVLFDFRREDDLKRLIVFIVVGTIAIGISILYLYIEKKERKEEALAEFSQNAKMLSFAENESTANVEAEEPSGEGNETVENLDRQSEGDNIDA